MQKAEIAFHERFMNREEFKRRFPNASESTLRRNSDPPICAAIAKTLAMSRDVAARELDREVGHGGIQEQIRKYCAAQWPRWKVIQARSDQRSTIGIGIHDMTVYLPGGRLLNVEVKAKGRKQTPGQLAWEHELKQLMHDVHIVYSLREFIALAKAELAKPA